MANQQPQLKVIGHKAPDTDSTCSPIVYAWYLTEMAGENAKAYLSGEPNKEALFVLDKFSVDKPEVLTKFSSDDLLVIVDTNNPDELLDGFNEATITEIIDHHKITGGLTTEQPINVTIRPTGCSATIIWQMISYELEEKEVPDYVYGLLAAGIISDTLNLSGPTTTDQDRQALAEINSILDLDINEFAESMFKAKSDVSDLSGKDILLADSKVYTFNDKKTRVAVMETIMPRTILEKKQEILSAIPVLKQEENLDYLFMFVVDIRQEESHLLVETQQEAELAKKAFGEEVSDNIAILPGVVSRKKQMVPVLERVIK